jgi:probable rRNA maturation factor
MTPRPARPAGDADGARDAGDDGDAECGERPPVEVADRQSRLRIDSADVIALVRFALGAEEVQGAVEVAFVDDAVISDLHARYFGDPSPTDVITFPSGDALEGEEWPALGEIVISTDTAARQAPEYGLDAVEEALLYVVHGVLHLVGYDDEDDDDAAQMSERQREILDDWLAERGGRGIT